MMKAYLLNQIERQNFLGEERHLIMSILKVVVVALVALFLFETVLRESGVSSHYRPTHLIYLGGVLVKSTYYRTGQLVGWIWYYLCEFGRFLYERLAQSLIQTIWDFGAAFEPYLQFREFFNGIASVVREYWNWFTEQYNVALFMYGIGLIGIPIFLSCGLPWMMGRE